MKIGWYCGKDDWAFQHVTEQLEAALPECQHVRNVSGDVSVFFVPEGLAKKKDALLNESIIRLGGNRWWSGS